ncbi:MAG TPA: RluA family pseudouridine synthase [Chitinophagales bacterium]|mgnify:CR=1 FL=1|nr:RluA family pseudouridine synthase [Chitinophagales bacterium]
MQLPKNLITTIKVIHEDNDIIVVNKPAYLLSIPDRYNPNIPNLQAFLRNRLPSVLTVHRIDRETSGIICFAKNEAAHRDLSMQFEKHTVRKIYHAIVEGILPEEVAEIDLPIAEIPSKRGVMNINYQTGKPSVSKYRIIEQFKNYAYVEILLKTGRTHQIRVHFQAIGHPLAVDSVYGGKEAFYLSSVKKNYHLKKYEDEKPMTDRITLHAYSLEFIHPTTNETVLYTAPLPKDMSAMLKQLQNYNRF